MEGRDGLNLRPPLRQRQVKNNKKGDPKVALISLKYSGMH